MTRGFHHVQLVVPDAAPALAFYRDLLGFAPAEGDDARLWLGAPQFAPGMLLALDVRPGLRRGHWGIGGVHHVALGVESEEAQLMWKRRLTDAGVAVSGPYDRGWFHSIYFTDPFRQILEIATSGPGYATDEPIERLGERVIDPGAARMRGRRDEAAIAARTHPAPVPAITADMALTGLHHVTGLTDDIVRADEFYHAALGLRLVKRSVNQDDPSTPHWFWANYDGTRVLPHSSYTLFEWKGSRYRARPGTGQTHRIAFRAPDREAVGEWEERLRALGIATSPIMDNAGRVGLAFAAPDGQPLALVADDARVTEGG